MRQLQTGTRWAENQNDLMGQPGHSIAIPFQPKRVYNSIPIPFLRPLLPFHSDYISTKQQLRIPALSIPPNGPASLSKDSLVNIGAAEVKGVILAKTELRGIGQEN